MTVKQAIQSSIKALEEEKKYLDEKFSNKSINIFDGNLEREVGGSSYYSFKIEKNQDLPEDTPIEVEVSALHFGEETEIVPQRVRGSVISNKLADQAQISLALEKNIGEFIKNATLHSNSSYLLQLLIDQLKEKELNEPLLQQLLSYETVQSKEKFLSTGTFLTQLAEPRRPNQPIFNQGQIDAVKKAIDNSVTYIWGPPGTGKTTVIAAIADFLINSGQKVLLASHTNVAIDNVVEKIGEKLLAIQSPLLYTGKIIRVGEMHFVQNEEIKQKLNLHHWVDLEKNRLIQIINQEKEKLNLLDTVQKALLLYEQEKNQGEKIELDLEKNQNLLTDVKSDIKNNKKKIKKLEQEINNQDKFLTEFESSKFFKKTINWLKAKSVQEKQVVYEEKLRSLEKLLEKNKNNQQLYKKEISKKNYELELNKENQLRYSEILKRYDFQPTPTKIQELKLKIDESKETIKLNENKIQVVKTTVLNNADLIATTLTKTYTQKEIADLNFDTVIVDEVSVAMIPQLLFVGGISKSKIILVGDFCQLPSIVMNRENQLVQEWLGTDIFEKTGIKKEIGNKNCLAFASLNEQFRMEKPIANLVNTIAYEPFNHKLITKKPRNEKRAEEILGSFGKKPIIFIDIDNITSSDYASKSHFNLLSAEYSIQIAKKYMDIKNCEVGIITPYRPQLNLLRAIKLDHEQELDQTEILTIHTAQGKEKDVIILDLVNSNNIKEIGRPLRGYKDSSAMKLINVAFSRAKEQLIILGSKELIQKQDKSSINDALSYLIKNDFIYEKDITELIPNYNFDGDEYVPLENESLIFLTEKTFDINLVQDLRHSKKSFIATFYSGKKATSSFFRKYKNVLFEAKKRNLNLLAFINPHGVTNEFKNELKNCGFEVIIEPRTHAKLYFIDDKILYLGSQNLTSENLKEASLRIIGKNACNEAMKNFGVINHINAYQKEKKLGEINYGKCPVCKAKLVLKRTSKTIYLKCSRCTYFCTPDDKILEQIYEKDYLLCDQGHKMVLRKNGQGAMFFGCSKYPKHKFTRRI